MITQVSIDNFKSLVDFEIKLTKFNCLVGLNGSGKSTVLNSIDFLSHVMIGDISGWLATRQWGISDLNSKLTKSRNIRFSVSMELDNRELAVWSGSFNPSTLSCHQETVTLNGVEVFKVSKGRVSSQAILTSEIMFTYQGSILSRLILPKDLPHLPKIQSVITMVKSISALCPMDTPNGKHKSVGALRLTTIRSKLSGIKKLLVFDEVETSIDPERIEGLTDDLVTSVHQIVVTTHSPMVLNFLDDGIAKEGVIYVYKSTNGHTKSCRLFDIPSLKQKLDMMGPGEAYIDTHLTPLNHEIDAAPIN